MTNDDTAPAEPASGVSAADAARRLAVDGPNALPGGERRTLLTITLETAPSWRCRCCRAWPCWPPCCWPALGPACGCPRPTRAFAFATLLSGNLSLILAHRSNRRGPCATWRTPNAVLWWVVGGARLRRRPTAA